MSDPQFRGMNAIVKNLSKFINLHKFYFIITSSIDRRSRRDVINGKFPKQAMDQTLAHHEGPVEKNRRSTSDLTSKSSTSTQSQVNSGSQSTGNGRSGKRRNPFGSGGGDNVMRRRIQSEVVGVERQHVKKENGSNHRKLFTALDSQQDEVPKFLSSGFFSLFFVVVVQHTVHINLCA